MRHDRGIEKRGGLQGILAGEKRADVELARFGKRATGKDMRFYPLEILPPDRANIQMPITEVRSHGCKLLLGLSLRQRQRAPDDIYDARGIGWDEWPDQHAGAVGPEGHAGRLDR